MWKAILRTLFRSVCVCVCVGACWNEEALKVQCVVRGMWPEKSFFVGNSAESPTLRGQQS